MQTKMRILFLAVLSLHFSTVMAQHTPTEIMQPIRDLFLAMEKNDSALAATAFTPDAILNTVFTDKEGVVRRNTSLASTIPAAFAKPKDQVFSEPIWNEKIQVDGDFAAVWVDYAFYRGNTFSHCGVDAFHLMRTPEGWKIFLITDTRRPSPCEIPKQILNRFQD
jgi:hypothetical protein